MEQPPSIIPVNTFVLEVAPEQPASVNAVTGDVAARITMAALDITSSNSTAPTVVKLTTRPNFIDDYPEEKKSDDEDSEEESDDEDSEEEATAIVCTLSPKHLFQQSLDLYCLPNEQVIISVEGPHKVSLTGYLVVHPLNESDDEESEDELPYDVDSEDEDELDFSSNARIEELEDSEDEAEVEQKPTKGKKLIKAAPKEENTKPSKKRATEEPEASAEKSKKQKKGEEKKVAFSKELEQGPSSKEAKKASTTKKLAGGVVIEDKKVGTGSVCKKGDKVSVRYIGKLQNGKSFDSNTSGKPFQFKLGAGQVIKGWDVGVAGMSVKGERRIVIPAPMAYGSQKLPGIPANSTLTFDVKLVGIK